MICGIHLNLWLSVNGNVRALEIPSVTILLTLMFCAVIVNLLTLI